MITKDVVFRTTSRFRDALFYGRSACADSPRRERSLRRRRFGASHSYSVVSAESISTVLFIGLEAETVSSCHRGSNLRLAPVSIHGTECKHLCDGVDESQSDSFAHQKSPISGDVLRNACVSDVRTSAPLSLTLLVRYADCAAR